MCGWELASWSEYVWVKVPRLAFELESYSVYASWLAYGWAMDPKLAYGSAYGSVVGSYRCSWK